MKVAIIGLVLLAVVSLYLNRAYAHFYEFIGAAHLQSPYSSTTFLLEAPPDPSNPHKKTTLRYVALGDSLSAGVGSGDYQQTFPYLVGQNLLKNSFEVTYVNLAVPGSRTEDVLQKQVPAAIGENPDYITLLIGINDLHALRSSQNFKDNYLKILDQLTKKTHAKITLINIPYLGLPLMAVPFDKFYLFKTRQFNGVIAGSAQAYNLPVIDLFADTNEAFQMHPEYYSTDKFHPSAQGYIYWSKFINVN